MKMIDQVKEKKKEKNIDLIKNTYCCMSSTFYRASENPEMLTLKLL